MKDINANFQWKCQPEAEAFLLKIVDEAQKGNAFIATLSHDLLTHTSTRLFDWLDHVIIGDSTVHEEALESTGFISDVATPTYRVFHHPGAQLPRVVVRDHDQPIVGVAFSVESIADFLQVRGMAGWIEGSPFSGYRRCCLSTDNGISLFAVERRGVQGMEPTYYDAGYVDKYIESIELWKTRPRDLEDSNEGMERALSIATQIIDLVGQDAAAWIILECERMYWQARNTAAQIQKNRQDRMGMGWANHDHHTFRSSRYLFSKLVRLFEILGFHCRERFYAGEEAGWGAQVMENSKCRLVLFLDVDLHRNEVEVDFAHHSLPALEHLGTIGLWCALHGDSILKSGMHHLEAQFMFAELVSDLAANGIGMMDPFSSFPYLKQAFTHGEVWHVDPKRVQPLVERGYITSEQANKFLSYGAVGSHMENLQRREGYKGFNQKNVSFIIKKTDPRRLVK
jgi:hypothetical protein